MFDKGSTINHLGGRGAKRKTKFCSEGHRKKKSVKGASEKKELRLASILIRPSTKKTKFLRSILAKK